MKELNRCVVGPLHILHDDKQWLTFCQSTQELENAGMQSHVQLGRTGSIGAAGAWIRRPAQAWRQRGQHRAIAASETQEDVPVHRGEHRLTGVRERRV